MCKKEADLSELIGKTLVNIDIDYERNRIIFLCLDGNVYMMYHEQDCCEDVTIEDVGGDAQYLLGSPLTMAECVHHDHIEGEFESSTSAWYKLATVNGYVTIRWYGESNGYYSEEVDFVKLELQATIDDNAKSIEFRPFNIEPYKNWKCKDCNFFGGQFCEAEDEENGICEEAEITAKHAYFAGRADGKKMAIEEIFNLIDDEDAQCEFCPVSGLERPDCLGVSCLPAIIKFLESLKEQNNEYKTDTSLR